MERSSTKHICNREINDDFIIRLIELLGPVILGVKPAEILSFPNYDINTKSKLDKIEGFFKTCSKISYIKFTYNLSSIKILFYNPKPLEVTLTDKRNLRILKSIGYPKKYSLDSYLNHLVEVMMTGNIPDEIGIFLGYPLKDVLGFIGHPSLKLTKVNGWRVYGDSRLSDKRYTEILEAKNKIKNLLNYLTPRDILLSA